MSDWNGNKTAVFVTNGDTSHSARERETRDYYATDPRAVEELLKREKFDINILEPACGGGHISTVLKAHGYEVVSADIVQRDYDDQDYTADFLRNRLAWYGDIITNPPYRYAKEFVEHAIEISERGVKVAMFLKLTFLESQKRYELFRSNPPKVLYVFSKRMGCALNGDFANQPGSAVAYGWYVWEVGWKGEPIIRWIQ